MTEVILGKSTIAEIDRDQRLEERKAYVLIAASQALPKRLRPPPLINVPLIFQLSGAVVAIHAGDTLTHLFFFGKQF